MCFKFSVNQRQEYIMVETCLKFGTHRDSLIPAFWYCVNIRNAYNITILKDGFKKTCPFKGLRNFRCATGCQILFCSSLVYKKLVLQNCKSKGSMNPCENGTHNEILGGQ